MAAAAALCLFLFYFTSFQYPRVLCQDVPPVEIRPLVPKGFKVSIKEDGFRFFGWRGNINHDFEQLNDGDIKKDMPRPVSGYFTFTNFNVTLNPGDVIYYWTFIIFKNGSNRMSGVEAFTVTEFFNRDGTPVRPDTQTTTTPIPVTTTLIPVTTTLIPVTTTPIPITTPKQEIIENTGRSVASVCNPSATEVNAGGLKACQGELIFNEEFDTQDFSNKWDAEVKFPLEPDFPYNLYCPDNGTLGVSDGNLVISPKLTDKIHSVEFVRTGQLDLGSRCMSEENDQSDCIAQASGPQILPPVQTAKITTRRTFSFKYGKVEVRAKMPSGDWLLPEIHLEPLNPSIYGSRNYLSGIMRVAFVKGNEALAKTLYGGPMLTGKEPFRSTLLQQKIGTENWNKDFHVYTMVWKPDGIDLSVDGENYGSVIPGDGFYNIATRHNVDRAGSWRRGTKMAPLDEMFYVSLGLRAGGINDFEDSPSKPWINNNRKALVNFHNHQDTWSKTWEGNSDLKVDYVRVYAL